ncbi:MAG TPA: amidohydrolase family protein [Candidatus Nanopelagicaceae bacterium]|nr:amidohydrolase family protein [Candidatus Nanopelagicaceae bacterium]
MLKSKLISEWVQVFDTHEHFGYLGNYSPKKPTIGLAKVFKGAYMHVPRHFKKMGEILQSRLGTDALNSLRSAIKHLYDIDILPIKPEKLELLNKRIKEAYKNPSYIYDTLTQKLNVTNVILDINPDLWEAWKHPIVQTTIRIDEVTFPFINVDTYKYRPWTAKNQLEQYSEKINKPLNTLEDFDDVLEKYFNSLRYMANTIKIGSAYERSIHFLYEKNDDGKITEIYDKIQKKEEYINEKEMRRWGNYVVTSLLEYAKKEKLPVQVHTGMASMVETNPVYLMDIMRKFSDVKFDIFHGGYPFHHTIPGILTQTYNAHVDLCWMPILSQSATKRLLTELIEMNCTDKVFAFGGDCENLEGTYGALLSIKDILAEVLIDFIEARKFSYDDAVDIGNRMLYENPKRIFS